MDKGADLRLLGSSRFSTPTRITGGDNDVFLDNKSLKKEKLKRLSSVGILGEMDKLSHSMGTNSTGKRVKLPKKFSDHFGSIDYAPAPRKLRSAMKKRQRESQKTCAPMLPGSRKEIGGFECRSKDCTKKHKTVTDEYKDSKESIITKDEEEAAQALFALAQTFTDTCVSKTSEVKPSSMHMSKKRCSVHVYICRFIKVLQTTESEGARVNVISDTNPRTDMHMINPQNHYSIGFNDHLSTPTVEKELPYFDTMDQHPSHWSTKILSKQQYTGCYRNWQNQKHDTMDLLSGSSIGIFGSKFTQGLESIHNLNTEQQCISMSLLATNKGKMEFSDCEEKEALLFVDNGPMLELSL